MAGEELQVVRLRDDFYRDGFNKILIALATIIGSIIFLIVISIHLYLAKPPPVYFGTDNEWRVLAPIPLNQPYLTTADLSQWTSETLPSLFAYDFVNYANQLQNNAQFFTDDGWKKFLDQINIYASSNLVQNSKMFLNPAAAGAPFVLNQGLLNGRYAWWIQMPINVTFITATKSYTQPLVVQALIVRISTLNNLYGVAIDNFIVTKGTGDQVIINNK